MKRLAWPMLLLSVALFACKNEREGELRAELARTAEERVEITAIEAARAEADEVAARLDAGRAGLDDARAQVAKAEAERDALRSAFDAAVARSGALQAEVGAVVSRAQEVATRGQRLDEEIERLRARATWARDQAVALAREIRPEDPGWATARRLDALAEFAERIAREYPGDREVVALAREPVRSAEPTPEQARDAASRAERLRDHFARIYELPAPEVAAKADAP